MKTQVRGKDLKILELTFSRDLFGHILILSHEQGVSLKYVLSYPLTPVSL